MENTSTVPDHSLRSLARVEWLSFSGCPSENVLLFAQAVHRFAFAHSRRKDGSWMADYAYGCFSGEALDWFEDLDHGVKQDWSKPRPAIITTFRQNNSVPTTSGAAAAPPSATTRSTSCSWVEPVDWTAFPKLTRIFLL
ncbi:hypothetical protein FRB94_004978 [Tulasnella sp. JGI-2019a]|nr:hypothetical protein FRB94_004978 [Tulasnella sp. JGI-2019a]